MVSVVTVSATTVRPPVPVLRQCSHLFTHHKYLFDVDHRHDAADFRLPNNAHCLAEWHFAVRAKHLHKTLARSAPRMIVWSVSISSGTPRRRRSRMAKRRRWHARLSILGGRSLLLGPRASQKGYPDLADHHYVRIETRIAALIAA